MRNFSKRTYSPQARTLLFSIFTYIFLNSFYDPLNDFVVPGRDSLFEKHRLAHLSESRLAFASHRIENRVYHTSRLFPLKLFCFCVCVMAQCKMCIRRVIVKVWKPLHWVKGMATEIGEINFWRRCGLGFKRWLPLPCFSISVVKHFLQM